MKTVAFCEYDKKAQLVLKKHWPDIPIFDDVRKYLNKKKSEDHKHVWIVTVDDENFPDSCLR